MAKKKPIRAWAITQNGILSYPLYRTEAEAREIKRKVKRLVLEVVNVEVKILPTKK